MFELQHLSSPKRSIDFSNVRPRMSGENRIDVLTGQNGTGKTWTLVTLINLLGLLKRPVGVGVNWRNGGFDGNLSGPPFFGLPPERVLAQTFSPFSRFPGPPAERHSIGDIYAIGRERVATYCPIGIHRRTSYVTSTLARRTLEQGLFRLSENIPQAQIVGQVLEYLKFKSEINLRYYITNSLLEIIAQFSDSRSLAEALVSWSSGPRSMVSVERWRVPRELREEVRISTDRVILIQLLEQAFMQLRAYEGGIGRDGRYIEMNIGLTGHRSSSEYTELQSAMLLRRLGLLTIARCDLFGLAGDRIELANASSGQQQYLCGMVALAGELRSDSLILIDEPELSLHPVWQMAYLKHLKAVVDTVEGCHVIVATHSPLIVQAAIENGLAIISLESGKSDADTRASFPDLEKGASVEGALVDVLGTPLRNSSFLSNELFELVTRAEQVPGSRNEVLKRLDELDGVYSENPGNDRECQIIMDVRNLISSGTAEDRNV